MSTVENDQLQLQSEYTETFTQMLLHPRRDVFYRVSGQVNDDQQSLPTPPPPHPPYTRSYLPSSMKVLPSTPLQQKIARRLGGVQNQNSGVVNLSAGAVGYVSRSCPPQKKVNLLKATTDTLKFSKFLAKNSAAAAAAVTFTEKQSPSLRPTPNSKQDSLNTSMKLTSTSQLHTPHSSSSSSSKTHIEAVLTASPSSSPIFTQPNSSLVQALKALPLSSFATRQLRKTTFNERSFEGQPQQEEDTVNCFNENEYSEVPPSKVVFHNPIIASMVGRTVKKKKKDNSIIRSVSQQSLNWQRPTTMATTTTTTATSSNHCSLKDLQQLQFFKECDQPSSSTSTINVSIGGSATSSSTTAASLLKYRMLQVRSTKSPSFFNNNYCIQTTNSDSHSTVASAAVRPSACTMQYGFSTISSTLSLNGVSVSNKTISSQKQIETSCCFIPPSLQPVGSYNHRSTMSHPRVIYSNAGRSGILEVVKMNSASSSFVQPQSRPSSSYLRKSVASPAKAVEVILTKPSLEEDGSDSKQVVCNSYKEIVSTPATELVSVSVQNESQAAAINASVEVPLISQPMRLSSVRNSLRNSSQSQFLTRSSSCSSNRISLPTLSRIPSIEGLFASNSNLQLQQPPQSPPAPDVHRKVSLRPSPLRSSERQLPHTPIVLQRNCVYTSNLNSSSPSSSSGGGGSQGQSNSIHLATTKSSDLKKTNNTIIRNLLKNAFEARFNTQTAPPPKLPFSTRQPPQ